MGFASDHTFDRKQMLKMALQDDKYLTGEMESAEFV